MASRQLLRRLSPILRGASRILPVARSAALIPRHTVLCEDLASRLASVRWKTKDVASDPDIINIQDEEDFKEKVLQSERPVIVDFHASWCGPCKLLGPRLQAVIEAEKGRVVMAKVDIDEHVEIAMRFNVESVPTVLGMKDGKILHTFIGLKEDEEIKSFVQSIQ